MRPPRRAVVKAIDGQVEVSQAGGGQALDWSSTAALAYRCQPRAGSPVTKRPSVSSGRAGDGNLRGAQARTAGASVGQTRRARQLRLTASMARKLPKSRGPTTPGATTRGLALEHRQAGSPRSPVRGGRDRHGRQEPETTKAKGRTSKVES